MSIWHKSVENSLVISAEEGKKSPSFAFSWQRLVPALGGSLLLVADLIQPPEHKCSNAAATGLLSVSRKPCGKGLRTLWRPAPPCPRSYRIPLGVATAGLHWY